MKFKSIGNILICIFVFSAGSTNLLFSNDFHHPSAPEQRIIKIACVGNSITYGSKIENREVNSYPAQLAAILNSGYEVGNFGSSGATLLRNGNSPYIKTQAYKKAIEFSPDLVYIKLGTNDTKPVNRVLINEFVSDLKFLIANFRELPSKPKIVLLLPVPIFSKDTFGITSFVLTEKIIPFIRQVAFETGCEIINLYDVLKEFPGMFPDKVHPSAEGAKIIAEKVAEHVQMQKSDSENAFYKKDLSHVVRTLDGRKIERYTYGPKESWGYPVDSSAWAYWAGWDGSIPLDSAIWKGRGPVIMKTDKQNLNSFYLVEPKQPRSDMPLCVVLHSANLTAFQYMARQHLIEGGANISTSTWVPDNFYALYLSSTNKEWWGWGDRPKDKPSSAEKRVLDIIEWIVTQNDIDRNRIYLCGPSMGGCGTLGIGMPNGDIFAAIRAAVPAGTEYAASRMGGFPPVPRKRSSREAIDAWTKTISGYGLPDPPVIVDFSAQNDRWSNTQPALLYAAHAGRLPLVLSWGPFGHSSSNVPVARFPLCNVALAFPWMEIRKNEAYPVFTNASCNQQSPWMGDTINSDESGQLNAYFRWKNQSDTPDNFSMLVWIEHPILDNPPPSMPESATSDITLRRLQNFKVEPGMNYYWKFTSNGKVLKSGNVTPDAANLITLPYITLTTKPVELAIEIKRKK